MASNMISLINIINVNKVSDFTYLMYYFPMNVYKFDIFIYGRQNINY